MKKTVDQKTVAQFQIHQLSKEAIAKIKGGANDKIDEIDEIVIIDVITP